MKRLELLDYSRFIAALCVISFHYFFNGITNGKISSITHIPQLVDIVKYGYLGVEFFFMISGYVIFFSANKKSAGDFLSARAIRLFPAFWFAVIFTSIAAQFMGEPLMSVSLGQFITNFTMFPNLFGFGFVDGAYWTLQYEWKFYFAVFFILAIGLQDRLKTIFLLWPLVILAAKVAGLSGLPFLGSYYCYFAAGCLFAIYKDQKELIVLIPLAVCLYLCASFSIEKAYLMEASKRVIYSGEIITTIIIMFFALFTFINSNFGSNLKLPGSKLAGSLTYPVYLIHAHFGYMLISTFATEQNKLTVYFASIVIVLALAYLIHLIAEKRMANFWHQIFQRSVGVAGNFLHNHATALTGSIYRNTIAKNR